MMESEWWNVVINPVALLQASACIMVFAKDTRGSIKTYAHRLVNDQAGSSLSTLLVQPENLQVRLPVKRQVWPTVAHDSTCVCPF